MSMQCESKAYWSSSQRINNEVPHGTEWFIFPRKDPDFAYGSSSLSQQGVFFVDSRRDAKEYQSTY